MKKFFAVILTLVMVSLIAAPMIASAQTGAKECCKVKRSYNDFYCGDTPTGGNPTRDKVVGASTGAACPEGTVNCATKDWGTICLMETVYNVTDWIFYIVLSIAVIFGVISGFMFMTSSGDPTKTEKARNLLMYMAIGLVVAALAKVIPSIVRTMVGV
ncbi:MAG TPA: pilin [Candidatus Pacearchaeota archaeon]|nr:pilin [Candidatus Pacearchaeota archaeon]